MEEKNVFKDIEPKAKLPKSMKEDVLSSIETTKLLLEFWDLFATKRVQVGIKSLEKREIMRNMLSSFYSKKNFFEGQRIKLGDIEGEIISIDNTSVTFKTATSKVVMPASALVENSVEILEDQ